MCDQQHFAIFPSADLLDDVEVLLDLPVTEALSRQLHQLIDQAAVSEAQLNHLYPHAIRNTHTHTHTDTQKILL